MGLPPQETAELWKHRGIFRVSVGIFLGEIAHVCLLNTPLERRSSLFSPCRRNGSQSPSLPDTGHTCALLSAVLRTGVFWSEEAALVCQAIQPEASSTFFRQKVS